MVKEDLRATLRTKRKQAKQVKPLQPTYTSNQSTPSAPSLFNLIYTRKWDHCIQVATNYPELAESKDRMGDLPLHEACSSGAPFQLIQTIHRSFPSAISQKGFCGRLPLHYASYNKPSLHAIQYLLKHFPDGAAQFDDDGRLPLHLAVVRNAPKQVMQVLIAAHPKALITPNQFGNTPEMLARNNIVYELLVEEKGKPRGIDQKLDIEKKLMRDWSGGSKSPILVASTEKKGPTKSVPPREIGSTKQPLTLSDNENIPKRSSDKIIISPKKTPSSKLPPQINKLPNTRNRLESTTKDFKKDDRSRQTGPASRSRSGRSVSSDRSRRTIQATDNDIVFLEDIANKKKNSKHQESPSRGNSPKSLLDYHEIVPGRIDRTKKKKEIMSTSNRRKVLPSPTRQWQYPAEKNSAPLDWKRRHFTRTIV